MQRVAPHQPVFEEVNLARHLAGLQQLVASRVLFAPRGRGQRGP
ncbi:MAG: hypothetical protein ACRYGH_08340 [Janthinobacterium lividum]